jgi:hypothetical protein
VNADFFVRFPQSTGAGIFTGIQRATGQADLAGMVRQVVASDRQRKRGTVFAWIKKD